MLIRLILTKGPPYPPAPQLCLPIVAHIFSSPGADFTKGLSPVSGSNLRLLSQIIGIFYLSPWAQL